MKCICVNQLTFAMLLNAFFRESRRSKGLFPSFADKVTSGMSIGSGGGDSRRGVPTENHRQLYKELG